MPVYEYEHLEQPCERGLLFEESQYMNDLPLTVCPDCGGPVRKVFGAPRYLKGQKSNSELRDLGFTKLVRRDDGIYENVTARDGESKVMDRRKPETFPHLHKTIRD